MYPASPLLPFEYSRFIKLSIKSRVSLPSSSLVSATSSQEVEHDHAFLPSPRRSRPILLLTGPNDKSPKDPDAHLRPSSPVPRIIITPPRQVIPALPHLPDHIIRHILSYLDDDNTMPPFSTLPIWLNLQGFIDETFLNDYRSMRGVCRSLRDMLPHEGLHLDLGSENRINQWMCQAPRALLPGIKRLCVDLPKPKQKRTQSTKLHASFHRLTRLLGHLTSLQELILCGCLLHLDLPKSRGNTTDLAFPSTFTIPTLKYLTIDAYVDREKGEYHAHLARLFISIAPNLRHLRFSLSDDPVEHWNYILSDSRVTTNMKGLKGLSFRYQGTGYKRDVDPTVFDTVKLLGMITTTCPDLERLDLNPGRSDMGRPDLQANSYSVSRDEWEKVHDGESHLPKAYGSAKTASWMSVLDLEHLEHLDALVEVKLEEYPEIMGHVQRGILWTEWEEHQASRTSYESWDTSFRQKHHIYRKIMVGLVERMRQRCPTLKSGAFWTDSTEDNGNDRCRWTWGIGRDGGVHVAEMPVHCAFLMMTRHYGGW